MVSGTPETAGPVFTPVQTGAGLPEAVAKRISEAITTGLIADGDQLPSEDRLAAQLGVSTQTLRASLMVLRQQGLVETRRGRGGGSFAKAPQTRPYADVTERLTRLSTADLRDLADEEFAIAGATAMLAARRYSPANLARLESLVAELRDTRDPVEASRVDSRFHIEVAVSCQSERLTRRQVTLQSEYIDLLWIPENAMDQHECARSHAEILDAIRSERDLEARRLAEEHARGDLRRIIALQLRMTA